MSNHHLYRHFDADNNLLYIGISKSAFARFTQHASTAEWADDIVTMTIERFDSRERLRAAEVAAIEKEKPKYNAENRVVDRGRVNDEVHGYAPSAKEIIEKCGGKMVFADGIGIMPITTKCWTHIPLKYLDRVCEAFDLKKEDVRPDMFSESA